MVDGVERGRLHEGRRLRTMDGGRVGRESNPAEAGGGGNFMVAVRATVSSSSLPRASASVRAAVGKNIFPGGGK